MMFAVILAAATLLSTDLQKEPIALRGDYDFYSAVQKSGEPECSERWHFNGDGTWIDYSGQQVVRESFRIENDGAIHKFFYTVIENNGLPDCQGLTTPIEIGREHRLDMYRASAGDIVLIQPSDVDRDVPQIIRPLGFLYPASDDGHSPKPWSDRKH